MRGLTLKEIELRDKSLLEEAHGKYILTRKERYQLEILKHVNPNVNSLQEHVELFTAMAELSGIIEKDIVNLTLR